MRKVLVSLITLAFSVGLTLPAQATTFTVSPWIFDPDNTGTVVSQWQQEPAPPATSPVTKDDCKNGGWMSFSNPSFKNQGECVSSAIHNPGQTPQGNWFLELEKNAPTATNSSAGANLDGVAGSTVTELGFDFMGYCGAGAPRFNVFTSSGVYYFFGCTSGTHTDLGNGWTRVRFTNADAFPSDGTTAFPGFGTVVTTGVEIVQDEGPAQVKLDNIDFNGMLVGQP